MTKIEHFPIDDEIVKKFIEKNKSVWDVGEKKHKSSRYIFINCSMVRMQVSWIMPKLLYAKGLQEKTGATPVVLTWRKNDKLTDFFNSFGILHVVLDDLCKKDVMSLIKALLKTISFMLTDGTGEGLKKLKVLDFNVGMNLYEDILRTSSLSTLKDCKNKIAIKKIFHILATIYALNKYCKKNQIVCAVTDDMAYHEGAFIKLFRKLVIPVFASSNVGERKVEFTDDGDIKRYPILYKEKFIDLIKEIPEDATQITDELLEKRFQGIGGKELDRGAFAGKKVLTKEEMMETLNLYSIGSSDRKNVVIMAHTFTDAVFNYGKYYFRDYYDWLEKTLSIAEKVTDVNWILKPHPTRHAYNESNDSIEDMFKRHEKDHMRLLSDDISSESIKNIADVIITIGGNAGAEYSCFGIPAIIVGKPFYSGWGFTIEPESYQSYKNKLENISSIPKLTKDQIDLAKRVFYMQNEAKKVVSDEYSFDDEFANLLNGKYKEMIGKMAVQYFKSNEGTIQYNTEILHDVIEYMEEHNIRECNYFRKGMYRGKSL